MTIGPGPSPRRLARGRFFFRPSQALSRRKKCDGQHDKPTSHPVMTKEATAPAVILAFSLVV